MKRPEKRVVDLSSRDYLFDLGFNLACDLWEKYFDWYINKKERRINMDGWGEGLEVYFHDLKPTVQKEILDYYGIDEPEEANWDTIPLFILQKGGESDESRD